MSDKLATALASSQLSNVAGRAIVSARGHHIIVDSPPPLGGPNEELNPIDVLLGALATCGTFVCETAAKEKGIAVDRIAVSVAGDFDPRGVCGDPVDSSIQALRIRLSISGPSQDEAEALADEFRKRCPVYGTLAKAVSIEMDVVAEPGR
jgi:putative redox protein